MTKQKCHGLTGFFSDFFLQNQRGYADDYNFDERPCWRWGFIGELFVAFVMHPH
jgi:hypothetical protein